MRIALLVMLAAIGAGPGGASAQASGSADAALATYRLTMPNIRKMVVTYQRLDSALRANPSLAAKFAGDTGARSVAELIARLDGEPLVRQMTAAAGLTTTDLVLTQIATFTAGMTDFAVQAGTPPPTDPVAAANLKLYQDNRVELEGITAQIKRLADERARQAGDQSEDPDQD